MKINISLLHNKSWRWKTCLLFLIIIKANTIGLAQTYQSRLDRNTFDVLQPSTYLKVGSTAGSHGVSLSGTATYNIPIELPLGTDGMVPKISMSYDSQGGNTYYGQGWTLNGLSQIARLNKDAYRHGWAKPVDLSQNDALAIDGNHLILADGVYGADGSTYRTESQTFSTIILHNDLTSPSAWFEVVAKTGLVTHYAQSFIGADNSKVISWFLSKVIDPNGNYMTYEYNFSNREILLEAIHYTGNESTGMQTYNTVRFLYHNLPADRIDRNSLYLRGNQILMHSLLQQIVIESNNAGELKHYDFEYALNASKTATMLQSVKETATVDGANESINGLTFLYGEAAALTYSELTAPTNTAGTAVYTGDNALCGDFNGDGYTDILRLNKQWAHENKWGYVFSTNSNGDGCNVWAPTNLGNPNADILPSPYYADFKIQLNTGNSNTSPNTVVFDNTLPTTYNLPNFTENISCTPWLSSPQSKEIHSYNSIISTNSDFDGDGADDVLSVVTEPYSLYSLTNNLFGGTLGQKIKGVQINSKLMAGANSQTQFIPMPDPNDESSVIGPLAEFGYAWDDRGINVVEVGDYDGDGRADIAIVTRPQMHWFNFHNPADVFGLMATWASLAPENQWLKYSYDDTFTCNNKVVVHIGLAKDDFALKLTNFDANGSFSVRGERYQSIVNPSPGLGLLGAPATISLGTDTPMPDGVQSRSGLDYEQLKQLTTRTMDIDGDRKSELVVKTVDGLFVYSINETFSTETRATTAYQAPSSNFMGNLPKKTYYADFNGDGKTDIFIKGGQFDVRDANNAIFYSTGTGFTTSFLPAVGMSPDYANMEDFIISDFNGDGKTDIMTAVYYDYLQDDMLDEYYLIVYYSTGTGFTVKTSYHIGGLNYPFKHNTGDEQGRTPVVQDFTGDGRPELLLSYHTDARTIQHYASGIPTYTTYIPEYNRTALLNFSLDNAPNRLTAVKDGLGNAVEFEYQPHTQMPNYTSPYFIQPDGSAPQDITHHNDPEDGSQSTALTATDAGVQTRPRPVFLVKRILTPDGVGGQRSLSHFYGKLWTTIDGRGSLGFEAMRTEDEQTRMTSESGSVFDTEVMLPKMVWSRMGLFKENLNNQDIYTCTNTSLSYNAFHLPTGDPRKGFDAYKKSEYGYNHVLKTTSRSKMDYDITTGNTNLINASLTVDATATIIQEGETKMGAFVSITPYGSNITPPPALPTKIKTNTQRSENGNVTTTTRLTAYEYNAAGDLISHSIIDPSNGQVYLQLKYDYYAPFSAVKSITTSDPAQPNLTKISRYLYDEYYRYTIRTSNPLLEATPGHIDDNTLPAQVTYTRYASTFATAYGRPDMITDVGNQTTTYQYDAFGRATNVSDQFGSADASLTWDNTLPDALFAQKVNASCAPTAITYYDRFGRPIQSFTEGYSPDGTSPPVHASGTRTYDNLGRVIEFTGMAWQGSASPINGSITYYDDRNDVVSYGRAQRMTNGAYTLDYTYSVDLGSNTIKTVVQKTLADGSVQTAYAIKDVTGQTTESGDDGGRAFYTYHANGRPTSSTTNDVTTSMKYDDFGRQIQLVEPNHGVATYKYDAFSELTKQTTPKGTFEMQYDVIGRLIQQKEYEGTGTTLTGKTQYEYITPTGTTVVDGINLLQSQTVERLVGGSMQTVHSVVNIYNTQHQLVHENETIEDVSLTKEYRYNTCGNLETTHYPGFVNAQNPNNSLSPMDVKNEYNTQGYLNAIKTIVNNVETTIFTPLETNQYGQYSKYKLGNGLTSTTNYDDFGLPTHYFTPNVSGSGAVQDYSMEWDNSTGNLLQRSDNRYNLRELFKYDLSERLTNVTSQFLNTTTGAWNDNQSLALSLTYNDKGSIETKSDVGSYNYNPTTQPHAAASVITNGQAPPSMRQEVQYTAFSQPKFIKQTPDAAAPNHFQKIDFTYGTHENRVKSVETENFNGTTTVKSTRYYFGDYERLAQDGAVRHIFYLGGEGLNTIIMANEADATPTYQHYYTYTDHLGSILTLTDEQGTIVHEQSFDAWGNDRKPSSWLPVSLPSSGGVGGGFSWLNRGYTGHEHHRTFGIINMNGRLYDPLLGQMLSPDNYAHNGTQGANRYSYVFNNPLKYNDPSGETPFGLLPVWWGQPIIAPISSIGMSQIPIASSVPTALGSLQAIPVTTPVAGISQIPTASSVPTTLGTLQTPAPAAASGASSSSAILGPIAVAVVIITQFIVNSANDIAQAQQASNYALEAGINTPNSSSFVNPPAPYSASPISQSTHDPRGGETGTQYYNDKGEFLYKANDGLPAAIAIVGEEHSFARKMMMVAKSRNIIHNSAINAYIRSITYSYNTQSIQNTISKRSPAHNAKGINKGQVVYAEYGNYFVRNKNGVYETATEPYTDYSRNMVFPKASNVPLLHMHPNPPGVSYYDQVGDVVTPLSNEGPSEQDWEQYTGDTYHKSTDINMTTSLLMHPNNTYFSVVAEAGYYYFYRVNVSQPNKKAGNFGVNTQRQVVKVQIRN